jgi:hypothetical protein
VAGGRWERPFRGEGMGVSDGVGEGVGVGHGVDAGVGEKMALGDRAPTLGSTPRP